MRSPTRPARRPRLNLVALEDRTTPAQFTVTTTADNGTNPPAGSLREAITKAEASPGLDDILFAIPGAGVQVITLADHLPNLTEPIRILGYTQPGAAENTLADGNNAKIRVQLDGAGAFFALFAPFGDMTGSLVEGLSIVNTSGPGLGFNGNASRDVVIRGNYIGLTADGAALGNAQEGISIGGTTGIRVGGPAPGDRNVIAGNTSRGVEFFPSTGGLIQGNYIGTDKNGTTAVPNKDHGVVVSGGTSHKVIGNVVSGNTLTGIFVASGQANMKFLGNKIGTDRTGNVALGNGSDGLFFFGGVGSGGSHQVGGTTPADRNIISGNGEDGVEIFRLNSTVLGNHIGTNAAGTAAIPNAAHGVNTGNGVTIGGTAAGAGNLISGNSTNGIAADSPVTIQGNRIGTKADGTSPLGNKVNGIERSGGGSIGLIGGTAPGAKNVIAFNGKFGVRLIFANKTTVSANSIHSNGDLGVILEASNSDQAAPDLTAAAVAGSTLTVNGTLTSTSSVFRIEFFASPAADPSGFGEGQVFLGSVNVTTEDDGTGTFVADIDASLDISGTKFRVITATATNTANGETSAFSNARSAVAPTGGTITGSVFADANNNKALDAGEAGVEGVTVFLDTNGDGKLTTGEPTVKSAAGTGDFAFAVTADGSYTVRIQVPAGLQQTTADPDPVAVAGGQTAGGVLFGLRAAPPATGGTIAGTVYNDRDGDGVRDPGDDGLGGVDVFADLDGDGTRDPGEPTAATDQTGAYALPIPDNGTFTVRASATGVGVRTTAEPTPIVLSGGQTVSGVDFGFRQPTTITGSVFEDADGDGTRDAGEAGQPAGSVFLDLDADGKLDVGEPAHPLTDAGDFQLAPVTKAGTYQVRYVPPAGATVTSANPVSVTVTTELTIPGVRFGVQTTPPAAATVRGFVYDDANGTGTRDAGEAGVGGGTVFLDLDADGTPDAGEPAAAPAGDGSYTLTAPAAGTFQVRYLPPAGNVEVLTANPVTVTVAAGESRDVDFGTRTVTAGTTIRGSVFNDANGNGIPDAGEGGVPGATAFLDLDGDGTRDGNEPTEPAAADGSFVFALTGGGNFLVRVVPPAGFATTTQNPVAVTVGSGQTATAAAVGLKAVTPSSAVLRGAVYQDLNGNRIRSADEPGLGGVTVYLDANNNRQLDDGEARTVSGGDGTYLFAVDAGSFAVRAVRPAGQRQTTEDPSTVVVSAKQDVAGLDFGFQGEAGFRARKGLVGWPRFAVGPGAGPSALDPGAGGSSQVNVYNSDGKLRFAATPFPQSPGGVRVAVGDVTNDDVPDVLAGTGPGGPPRVAVLGGVDGQLVREVESFEPSFTGGVYVAVGDFDGDGFDDTVVTPDQGGGPRVVVRSGRDGSLLANFFGIEDPNFRGGARASVGDVNGDGVPDLIVAAGFQGGPRVAVFDGKSLRPGSTPVKLFNDFFAFEQTLRNGVFIASGDLDGDGKAEVVAGGGPGGGPRVTAFSSTDLINSGGGTLTQVANFFGGNPDNRGGIRVSIKDLDSDNRADLVVGDGEGAGSRVTAYLGKNVGPAGTPAVAFEFDAFPGFAGGVFVG